MVKKTAKNEVKQAITVTIKIYSEVLIDKVYNIGEYQISELLRSQIEDKQIVKKGIVVRL